MTKALRGVRPNSWLAAASLKPQTLRNPIGEQHRGQRPGDPLTEIDHSHPVERPHACLLEIP